MIKALLKKQLSELFAMLFYDRKRNRRVSVIGEAFEQGQEDGRKVSLNKQLNNNGSGQQEIEFKD